ncbi:MAG: hypothetical protein KGJ66_10780 [Alphaproteobacteria bacterium]|nr:hypothetical protein [Alphaproteobacteria bacterium]
MLLIAMSRATMTSAGVCGNNMATYYVQPDWLAQRAIHPKDETIRVAIEQLIERYDIKNRNILSLGSGFAYEERHLVELGKNRMTAIDNNKDIEPILRKAPTGEMIYIIGDARKKLPGSFDVLYVSSLLPDEVRRHQIASNPSWLDRKAKHGFGIDPDQWPIWRGPFHRIIMRHVRALNRGGLLIVQSYAYSLDPHFHKHYLSALRLQLRLHRMVLLEIHSFVQ